MLRLVADENFNNDILRGIRRRNATVDLLRVQDEGLSGADDPTILDWAAKADRVVLTHDVATMTRHAYDRVREGKPMPGVFEVSRDVPIGVAIEEILVLAECSTAGSGKVRCAIFRSARRGGDGEVRMAGDPALRVEFALARGQMYSIRREKGDVYCGCNGRS